MSTKNIYLFKTIIRDTQTNNEVPVNLFRGLFQEVFGRECRNNALELTYQNAEPMILDVIEDTAEYLFAKLNRKRPNNSMQKRNYNTYETMDVLSPNEIANSGVEWFTYCILGYRHGILSVVNSKGAPNEGALARVFSRYNNRFSLETEGIPNQELIKELLNGRAPEINKVQIDIAQPDAQILEKLFEFNDDEVLQAVRQNTSSLVFEVKPAFREALSKDIDIITRLIRKCQQNRKRYRSVILSGKPATGERQRQYDLYEEYFKYPISVDEYRQEHGQKVEIDKEVILREYKRNMMNVYDQYKDVILAVSNR
ncbi:hypothetical protein [Acetonema longum]|uniref:Uncharacterized protein n=1 Tax=Acetonema longum DSM 6540 TaxID=1009370 RepID=F7NM48_9FIRM|nr:hypothetical protein [Acetonema longum]EGO62884.1 hypothetical protein ALO_15872 [Acetonema longum DSM 6540]